MMGEAWDTFIKGVQACWHGNGCREPIPLIYCSWEIAVLDISSGIYYRDEWHGMIIAHVPDLRLEFTAEVDSNETIQGLLEEDQPDVCPSLL